MTWVGVSMQETNCEGLNVVVFDQLRNCCTDGRLIELSADRPIEHYTFWNFSA